MFEKQYRERPIIFWILLAVCLLIAILMIFSFVRRMNYRENWVGSFLPLLLWLFICAGFYKVKKWAWVSVGVLVLFSILNIIHHLITQRMVLDWFSLVSVALGFLIIGFLNVGTLRSLFQIDFRKGQRLSTGIANFAILCFTIGLFLLMGMNKIATSSNTARLFVGSLGCVYLLLGIGIWQLNKIALQSVHPVLIFMVLAAFIIMAHDFFEVKRFLALQNSIFYISLSSGMLIYWVTFLRHKIPNDDK